jgi:hypothetical protein
MSFPQHILYEVGATISVDVTSASGTPANAQVVITDADGGTWLASAAATVSTIDTTTTAAISKGDRTVALTAATGVSSGQEFWLRDPDEKVRCKSLATKTATLYRPTLYAHASGITVDSTLLTYAVSAANATPLGWDMRAAWSLEGTLTLYTAVECTKYPLDRMATEQDCADECPDFAQVISGNDDTSALLDSAHERVLSRIGGRARVRVYPGSEAFILATALAVMVRLYRPRPGAAAQQLYDRYRQELQEVIDEMQNWAPRDTDQDGIIEEAEQISTRTGRIYRGG